jgi:hypothetical protein
MDQTRNALTRLAATLSSAQPSVVARAMRTQQTHTLGGVSPELAAGQCWRLRWNDDVALAVITRVDDDYLLVMPIDLSPDAADETALVVPGAPAGFETDVAVFAMLETGVGPWTLEFLVTDLVGPAGASALRGWLKGNEDELPDGWRYGSPTQHDAHPRRMNRAALGANISVLGEAEWLDTGWSRNAAQALAAGPSITADTIRAMWEVIGGTPQRCSTIALGRVEPTEDERLKLEAAGLSVSTQTPEPDVLRFLDTVEAKSSLVLVSSRRNQDEGQLRREVAVKTLAMAARPDNSSGTDVSPQVRLAQDELNRLVADVED